MPEEFDFVRNGVYPFLEEKSEIARIDQSADEAVRAGQLPSYPDIPTRRPARYASSMADLLYQWYFDPVTEYQHPVVWHALRVDRAHPKDRSTRRRAKRLIEEYRNADARERADVNYWQRLDVELRCQALKIDFEPVQPRQTAKKAARANETLEATAVTPTQSVQAEMTSTTDGEKQDGLIELTAPYSIGESERRKAAVSAKAKSGIETALFFLVAAVVLSVVAAGAWQLLNSPTAALPILVVAVGSFIFWIGKNWNRD